MPGDAPTVEVDFSEWDELAGLVVDPDMHGCLIIEQHPDGMGRAGLLYRPGLPVDVLRTLGEWALQRVGRFLEHGPEPDGWQARADGGWQLWGRLTALPALD